MPTNYGALHDQLRDKYATPAQLSQPSRQPKLDVERAFVTHAESGRTVITTPVRELASLNPGFMSLTGRFVEADRPNRNNAYWTSGDLELGNATVAGGPLNWLHEETHIIGSLTSSRFTISDTPEIGNHIEADAVMWRYLFPSHAQVMEQASWDGSLFYSMECVSSSVECQDCFERVSYSDYMHQHACAHLVERSAVRRFVDPIFLGGAVIVPPTNPGWANADLKITAAAEVERAGLAEGNRTSKEAVALAAAILQWANRD